MARHELPNTTCWARQVRKNHDFRIDAVNPSAERAATSSGTEAPSAKLMPWNSSLLLNVLENGTLNPSRLSDGSYANPQGCLQGTRFDCLEPRVRGKSVEEGSRFSIAQAWIFRLVPQFYRCRELGLEYNRNDLVHTFRTLCRRNFEDYSEWWNETGKGMVPGLLKELDDCASLSYAEIESKYQPSHTNPMYRRKGYAYAVTMDICQNYANVTEEGTFVFPSKQVLDAILKDKFLPYNTFRRYVNLLGYSTSFQDDGRTSGKYNHIMDSAKETDGTVYYAIPSNALKCFCRKHNLKYNSLFSICTFDRKKYDAIIKESRDAFNYMVNALETKGNGSGFPVTSNSVEEIGTLDDLPYDVIEEKPDDWIGSISCSEIDA